MKSKPRLVRVEWLDAISKTAWSDKEAVREWVSLPVTPAVSVGFILRDDAECLVLAADENDEEWGNITKIPRGMVVKVEQLRRVRGSGNDKAKPA